MPKLKGKCWKYGNDINTDYIVPDPVRFDMIPFEQRLVEMGKVAMEGTPPELGDPEFAKKLERGDFIVAGQNFGAGSSREEGVLCIKAAGTGAVLAESFARIWYRNAINNGLLALNVKGILKKVRQGDELKIDTERGIIKNLNTGEMIKIKPVPKFIIDILQKGGLIPAVKGSLPR